MPPNSELDDVLRLYRKNKRTGTKALHKEVSSTFIMLKKMEDKLREKIRTGQFLHCPQHSKMVDLLTSVGESIDRVQLWFSLGEYAACDDEIWRARVELECLDHLVEVAKAHRHLV